MTPAIPLRCSDDVGLGDACGQHSDPHFTILRLGAFFFNHPKRIWPAIVRDDGARVVYTSLFPLGLNLVRRNYCLYRQNALKVPRP
jgi:hypothetical protein